MSSHDEDFVQENEDRGGKRTEGDGKGAERDASDEDGVSDDPEAVMNGPDGVMEPPEADSRDHVHVHSALVAVKARASPVMGDQLLEVIVEDGSLFRR
jgi:hypothetical protein